MNGKTGSEACRGYRLALAICDSYHVDEGNRHGMHLESRVAGRAWER